MPSLLETNATEGNVLRSPMSLNRINRDLEHSNARIKRCRAAPQTAFKAKSLSIVTVAIPKRAENRPPTALGFDFSSLEIKHCNYRIYNGLRRLDGQNARTAGL